MPEGEDNSGKTGRGAGRGKTRRSGSRSARVWVTPAEFERWLPGQGIKISHQKLYATYLGRNAPHQIERNAKNKIHREKTAAIIRLVQGKVDLAGTQRILAERQAAETDYRKTMAERARLKLGRERGDLVEKAIWRGVILRAIEAMKQDHRTLAHTLPDALAGHSRAEQGQMIETALNGSLKHLADGFSKLGS